MSQKQLILAGFESMIIDRLNRHMRRSKHSSAAPLLGGDLVIRPSGASQATNGSFSMELLERRLSTRVKGPAQVAVVSTNARIDQWVADLPKRYPQIVASKVFRPLEGNCLDEDLLDLIDFSFETFNLFDLDWVRTLDQACPFGHYLCVGSDFTLGLRYAGVPPSLISSRFRILSIGAAENNETCQDPDYQLTKIDGEQRSHWYVLHDDSVQFKATRATLKLFQHCTGRTAEEAIERLRRSTCGKLTPLPSG